MNLFIKLKVFSLVMKTGVKVGDVMTRRLISVYSDDNLIECAKIMVKEGIGNLVIKDGERLVGIITEKDFMTNTATGVNFKTTKVGDVMTRRLTTVRADMDIFDAMKIMADRNVRRLPVVNDGELVGLLTYKDVLKIAPQLFDLFVEKFRIREHRDECGDGVCNKCGTYSETLFNVGGILICRDCK